VIAVPLLQHDAYFVQVREKLLPLTAAPDVDVTGPVGTIG
jgi:hypothetical protein